MVKGFLSATEEQAVALIDEGWFQVSRKFRHLARLPEGKTGIEALIEACLKSIGRGSHSEYWPTEIKRWAEDMGEGPAADHFMRCYASAIPGLTCTVDRDIFEAFRRLGGGTVR